MIDFIKNSFSAVLSFFVGLFGGKKAAQDNPSLKAAAKPAAGSTKKRKSSGYFMELDEAEESKSVNGSQPIKDAAAKTLETAKNATTKTLETAKNATAKTLETAKETTAKTLGTAKEATAKTLETAKDTTTKTLETAGSATDEQKSDKSTKQKSAKTPEPAAAQPVQIELVQTAKGVQPEAAQPSVIKNSQKPAETTFAPKYLTPTNSNGRRRPGPNMNPFLDMARQVKSPN